MAKTKEYRDRGTDTPDTPHGVVSIDTAASAARLQQAEQVDIFSVDGKVYSMAKAVRAEIPLTYLRLLRNRGEDEASAYLITEALGEEALDALSSVKGLDERQWKAVMKAVVKYALPKDRGRKGND